MERFFLILRLFIHPSMLARERDNQMEGVTGFALAVHARLDEWTSRWADEESDCVEDIYIYQLNRIVSKLAMTQPVYLSICLFIYNIVDE